MRTYQFALFLFVVGMGGVYLYSARDTCADASAYEGYHFVVTAFQPETDAMMAVIERVDSCVSGGIRYTTAQVGGVPIVLYESGVGHVPAHRTTAYTLSRFSVRSLVFVGVAGGVQGSGVALGDTVVAERWVDMESRDSLAVDGNLLQHLRAIDGVTVVPRGGMARAFVTDHASVTEDVSVVSMETYTMLRVAKVHGVPCIDVRTISDMVGENEGTRTYDTAAATSAGVFVTYLRALHGRE